MRWIALLLLTLSACLPSFPDEECYADVDCPSELVCGAGNRCVPADARRDGGTRDGGTRDGGVSDAGTQADGGDDRDGGTRDSGPRDGGVTDAGFDVRVAPTAIDFSVRAIGCPETIERVSLENASSTNVRIESIQLTAGTSNEFTVAGPPAPFTLPALQARQIDVGYLPSNNGVDQGAFQVTFAGGAERIQVDLSGEGQANPEVTENFVATAGPIDVLFVIDSGPNMSALQQRLTDRVVFTLLNLDVVGWDYRIAVTTADTTAAGAAGMFVGTPTVLTPQMSNRQTLLENRLEAGQAGSSERTAFDAVELALSSPLINGANAGFLRTDAPLFVFYFSLVDDSSTSNTASHLAFLEGLKAGTNQPVQVNAITPTIAGCSLKGGAFGIEGTRFIALSMQTMGTVSNMCGSTWDPALTTLPDEQVRRSYELSANVVPGSVVVEVDGTPVPSNAGANWSYDATEGAVVFTEAGTPTAGADVVIRYRPSC